ncbi:PspC domain-containing protein [Arthrobacter bambusae]|uniref:PspC domain-containing protein n=1 Tax=Arthrobacter bambusae TaxID=1338426 RepID=UPI002786CAF7|nr:PspC domain-containing protein [Arthrobacter bambusae]MDQ0030947.1 phage shock protein PspC (stress-responsive transcriptional regulator) [Arthrobacter bambusae]MDQ0098920.1 phage shock protein PspC (stress-responsive transcriptional regulator) [Arthrobacter bambusae]
MNANSMNPEDPGQAAEPGQPAEPSHPAGTGSPEEPAQPNSGSTGGAAPYYAAPAPPQNFFTWIRSQGISRGRDRWMGGVASGIAHRFGIDPLIVRGIFIILTLFAGIGILLYGLAWALLPEPDGRIHAQEAGAGRWSAGMTGALITTIIGLPSLGHGFWGWGLNGVPGILWTLFWVGGIIYLVYFLVQRSKSRNGRQTMGTQHYAAAPGSPGGAGTHASAGYPAGPSSAGPYSAGPYSAGPYSAGPYSAGPATPSGPFDPPGPTPPAGVPNRPERPERPRRQGPGAAIVAVSAGAALLAGGTLKLLDAGNVIHLGDAANAVVWATGSAVLGLGILVAGLRGRTSGLLGFLAVATLVIGGIFNVAPNADRFRLQNAQWNPVSIEDARKGFDITGANGTVDLTRLNLSAPLGSDVVVPMDVTASNIKLLIPATVPVEVQADMTFANLKQDGSAVTQSNGGTRDSFNTDKPGAKLVVKLNGTFSNVTVQEGN